jgi:thymidine phosphorylase
MDTRAIGLAVVALGGGRARADQTIDPRVGLADVLAVGTPVVRGQPLATVHAASDDAAETALRTLAQAIHIGDSAEPLPAVHAIVDA